MILVMFPIFIGDLIGRNDNGWNLDLSCHDIMRSFLQVVITRTLAEADELGTALPRYIREGWSHTRMFMAYVERTDHTHPCLMFMAYVERTGQQMDNGLIDRWKSVSKQLINGWNLTALILGWCVTLKVPERARRGWARVCQGSEEAGSKVSGE